MSATVYPASLSQKANGFRYQAWCHEHKDGMNTKTRPQAKKWCDNHNAAEHADS